MQFFKIGHSYLNLVNVSLEIFQFLLRLLLVIWGILTITYVCALQEMEKSGIPSDGFFGVPIFQVFLLDI
jgi:hypothetical protein